MADQPKPSYIANIEAASEEELRSIRDLVVRKLAERAHAARIASGSDKLTGHDSVEHRQS